MRSSTWATPARETVNPSPSGRVPGRLLAVVSAALVTVLAAGGLAVVDAASARAATADPSSCVVYSGSTPDPSCATVPDELPEEVPAPEESPAPVVEAPAPEQSSAPEVSPAPEQSPAPEVSPAPEASPAPEVSPAPDESPAPSDPYEEPYPSDPGYEGPVTAPYAPTLNADECASPYSTATVTVDLTELTPGRSYRLEVDGTVSGDDFTPSGPTYSTTVELAAGDHTVTVVDSDDSSLTASAGVQVAECSVAPADPAVSVAVTACVADDQTSTLDIALTGLADGVDYEVLVDSLETGAPAREASYSAITGPTATISHPGARNGVLYQVTLVSADGYFSQTVEITPEECGGESPVVVVPPADPGDPGDPADPGQLPTLALNGSLVTTGSEPVWPLLSGVAFLILGAVLVTVTAARRRKEVGA